MLTPLFSIPPIYAVVFGVYGGIRRYWEPSLHVREERDREEGMEQGEGEA